MNKIEMVALRATYYAGKVIPEGRTFSVDPKHVRLLVATHAAKVAEEPEKKRKYNRRDMQAAD